MKTILGIYIVCFGLLLVAVIPYWIGRIINYRHDNYYYKETHKKSFDFKLSKWFHGMAIISILLTIYFLGKAIGNHIL